MPYVAARSRSGTTIGGWLTIRYAPSTNSPSLDSACMLSRVRAFRRVCSARLAAFCTSFSRFFASFPDAFAAFFASATVVRNAVMISSSSRCAYQRSIVRIVANSVMAFR